MKGFYDIVLRSDIIWPKCFVSKLKKKLRDGFLNTSKYILIFYCTHTEIYIHYFVELRALEINSFLLYVLGSAICCPNLSKSAVLLLNKSAPMLVIDVLLWTSIGVGRCWTCDKEGIFWGVLGWWIVNFCLCGTFVSNSFLLTGPAVNDDELFCSSFCNRRFSLTPVSLFLDECSLKSWSPKKTWPSLDR